MLFGSSRAVSGASDVTDEEGFTSQKRLDAGNGNANRELYYYGARWYLPGVGVFAQPDTVVPYYDKSQALNRYCYSANNPVKYVDPTGHKWDDYGVWYDDGTGDSDDYSSALYNNNQEDWAAEQAAGGMEYWTYSENQGEPIATGSETDPESSTTIITSKPITPTSSLSQEEKDVINLLTPSPPNGLPINEISESAKGMVQSLLASDAGRQLPSAARGAAFAGAALLPKAGEWTVFGAAVISIADQVGPYTQYAPLEPGRTYAGGIGPRPYVHEQALSVSLYEDRFPTPKLEGISAHNIYRGPGLYARP